MGLYISAYSKIKFIGPIGARDRTVGQFEFELPGTDSWPQRDQLQLGLYSFEAQRGFCAGSYSGHNAWRRLTAQLVGTSDHDIWAAARRGDWAGPFVELINFSDCEGFIGPVTSAKLAHDFQTWRERARVFRDEPWWFNRYQCWQQTFELASQEGVVRFT